MWSGVQTDNFRRNTFLKACATKLNVVHKRVKQNTALIYGADLVGIYFIQNFGLNFFTINDKECFL